MIEGVDYSLARPDPTCLFKAGKRFASRYLSPPGGINKDLTRDEAKALSAAGIAIVANWEDFETRPLRGHDTGVQDATAALTMALVCGMPAGKPIYFSVDFDASTAQMESAVGPYFQGCIEVLGLEQVGAYGGLRVIRWLFDHNLIKWGWQTYAWSGGVWDPRAQVQQYKNSQVVCGTPGIDLDRAVVDDFGQWFLEEDELANSDEILAEAKAANMSAQAALNEVKDLAGAFGTFREREYGRDAADRERDEQILALVKTLPNNADVARIKQRLIDALS